MARAATTADVFNAIAEPQRRRILTLLAGGEQSVNDIARSLRLKQPQASKHLGVLKAVGLVNVRGVGRSRLYTMNARKLKPVHDWVRAFEKLWADRLDRLDEYLNELQSGEIRDEPTN
ncbi:MAG: metalloregulator ArsR/SmtB family transcription factor [Fimbriiglobus sp.]|jgi:DNA-binding transcriptional ArsR family regulator|nr:metalloregulator ArsR/SmtB family transcription factor [Fimbriiglobus sp.]